MWLRECAVKTRNNKFRWTKMSATSTHSEASDPLEEAYRRLLAIMHGEDDDEWQNTDGNSSLNAA